jgi:hypothetical protein
MRKIDRYDIPVILITIACIINCSICLNEARTIQARFEVAECHSAPAFVTPEAAESLGY